MAEGTSLLRKHTGKTCIVGSNPTVSARSSRKPRLVRGFLFLNAEDQSGDKACQRNGNRHGDPDQPMPGAPGLGTARRGFGATLCDNTLIARENFLEVSFSPGSLISQLLSKCSPCRSSRSPSFSNPPSTQVRSLITSSCSRSTDRCKRALLSRRVAMSDSSLVMRV